MASMFKQDGVYYPQFYHNDRKPKQTRISLKVRTKRDAEKLRSKLERDYGLGVFDPWTEDPFTYDREIEASCELTIDQALKLFLERKKLEQKSPKTINTYRWLIDGLIKRVGSGLLMRDVRPDMIRTYTFDASVSKSTCRTRFTHVRTFLKWCESEGYLATNPIRSLEVPDKAHKLPKAVTAEEVEASIKKLDAYYATQLASNLCREGEIIWAFPLFRFTLLTGLRAPELGRLKWRHIDLEKRQLTFLEQKNKREQTIPLSRKAVQILAGIERGEPEDYVFRSPRQQAN